MDNNPDCISYAAGRECADRHLDVPVEEIIPHYLFDDRYDNDIGLVRLSRDVPLSDYIHPICIPWSQVNSEPGDKVMVAGWGRTLNAKRSAIKQKLMIAIANREDCVARYAREGRTITDKQICAGGGYLEDTCDGDSGGPLMAEVGQQWFAEGIVSFGYRCGIEGWPAIYTRVSEYLDWIRSTVRN